MTRIRSRRKFLTHKNGGGVSAKHKNGIRQGGGVRQPSKKHNMIFERSLMVKMHK